MAFELIKIDIKFYVMGETVSPIAVSDDKEKLVNHVTTLKGKLVDEVPYEAKTSEYPFYLIRPIDTIILK